jgi:hypothetical protein
VAVALDVPKGHATVTRSDFNPKLEDQGTMTNESTAQEGAAETTEAPTEGKGKKAKKGGSKKAKAQKADAAPAPAEGAAPVALATADPSQLTEAQNAYLEGCADAYEAAKAAGKPGKPLRIHPTMVAIVGLDVPDNPADPLTDPEALKDVEDPVWVQFLEEAGILDAGAIGTVERSALSGRPYLAVLDGRQRTMHLRTADLNRANRGEDPHLLPVVVEHHLGDADQAIMVSALNDYRREHSFMRKAFRCKRLANRFAPDGKVTPEVKSMVAAAMHSTVRGVEDWLKVVDAPPAAHKAIDEGKITATAFLPLLRLADVQDEETGEKGGPKAVSAALSAVLEEADGRVPSVKEVKGFVKRELGEVDEEEGESSGGKSSGPATWAKGTPPKKRFVSKVADRLLEQIDPETPEGQTGELILKVLGWVLEGNAPPKELSPHVRAVNAQLGG